MVHTMLLASTGIPARGPQVHHPFQLSDEGLHCDVVFGSPSADCRGTGICKITGTNGFLIRDQRYQCQQTKAVLLERADKQGITLIFFRSLLCSKLFRHHFWKGVLTVEEACFLPAEIQEKMENSFFQIKPGRYQVEESGGYFKIEVDCA